MGLCGCYPSCACQVEAGNDLVTVTGTGDATDPFVISGVETPLALENVDGGLTIQQLGPYGHSSRINLKFEDSDTIALGIGANGLFATLLNAPGEGGGVPTGTPLPWLANVAPAGYLMLSGPNKAGYVDIADYPALFAVIDHKLSGGVDPMDGTFYVGFPDDSTLITQGTLGGIGTPGGVMDVTLGASQIPNHGHGVSDPTHAHPGSTLYIDPDGQHQHDGAGANQDFIVENSSPSSYEYLHIDATNVDTAGTFRMPSNGVEGGLSKKPNREALTYPDGQHDHAGSSITVVAAATGVAVLDSTGGGGSHTNMQPYVVVNYMVKT